MSSTHRYDWYPLEEPTDAVAPNIPKDLLVAAKFMGLGLTSVEVSRAIRDGDTLYIDFRLNGSNVRISTEVVEGYRTYRVATGDLVGYVTTYNTDVVGVVDINTEIIPTLIYDYSGALASKVTVKGTSGTSGWQGTLEEVELEFDDILELVAGYNCSISYNADINTIYISRNEGMGEGTQNPPCPVPPAGSIIRINGVMLSTEDISIEGDGGVEVENTGAGVKLYLDEGAALGVEEALSSEEGAA